MFDVPGYNPGMTRVLVGWLAVTLLAVSVRAEGVSPERVEAAIRRGVMYLREQQKDGHWEHGPWAQHATGRTALATYALLSAGQKANAPEVGAALTYLRKNPTGSVYALGLRAQVWEALGHRELRPFMAADLRGLHLAIRNSGDANGMFHYTAGKGSEYDHSTSQFGILGLWAMERAGMEIETRTWRVADTAWRKHQLSDGGWGYRSGPGETATVSMTAAGVATLFITQDQTRSAAGCAGNPADANLERGLQWIGDHFGRTFSENHLGGVPYYTLFGISRIGIISGRKYLGPHDWYAQGARWLLARQRMDGAWGGDGGEIDDPVVATSFALLFLARGSAPVVMQKLQYKVASGQNLVEGPWAQRPRDLSNLTSWMGRQLERNFNWQSTPLDGGGETLHDAPILYIGGHLAPVFSAEEKGVVRRFVHEGGLILGHADCGAEAFSTAFQKLGTELFPGYSFRELPREHPIYTSETIQYQPNKWPQRPTVLGLSNGVRELMLLLPNADASKAWQMSDDKAKAELFQLASNLVLYATDNQPMNKGRTYMVRPDENRGTTHTITVARLRYEGNWDPEPGGWRQLAAVMHNHGVRLVSEPVGIGEGRLAKHKIAHLTGTDKLPLTDPMRAELRTFLAAGGTLIVDAAGGSGEFAESAGELLRAIVPANARLHEPIAADHPAFRGVPAVGFRHWARSKHLARGEKPQVRGYEIGGRMAVLFSGVDLSAGLVGQPMDGINGYTPKSATELMEAMLRYAGGVP